MPQVDFQVDGHQIGTLNIDPLKIGADGGPDYPSLNVQADITLRPIEWEHPRMSAEPSPDVQHFTLIQINGRLFFEATGRGQIPIADFATKPLLIFSGSAQRAVGVPFSIPLDNYRVRRIEEQRNGDCALKLDLTCLFARHPRVDRNLQYAQRSIEALTTCWTPIDGITIPLSHWVTLLPKLGYGSVQIIEIPMAEALIPEPFRQSVGELRLAQDALIQANYDHAVSLCRQALQRMEQVFPLATPPGGRVPTFRNQIDNLINTIGPTLSQRHRDNLPAIINALWGLTSAPVHPHPPGIFNRNDAESIFILTAATLAYIGKLIEAHNQAIAAAPPPTPTP